MLDYDPAFQEKLFDFIKYYDSFNLITILIEISTYLIVGFLFYHGFKKYGIKKMSLYFLGIFFLGTIVEHYMILSGFYTEYILHSTKTYYYNLHLYTFWIGAVPIVVPLAWFILTYSSYQIAETVFLQEKKHVLLKRALLAGMLGMTIDFIIDPIIIRRSGWIWLNNLGDTFWFLQVPMTNFLGFFLIVSSFNYYFVWFWESFIPKRTSWHQLIHIIVYFVMILIPFLIVVILLIGFVILQAIFGLNGIDLSWWPWLNN
jgi:uncharacterized membrane protein